MTADLLRKTRMSGVGRVKNLFVRERTLKNKKKKIDKCGKFPNIARGTFLRRNLGFFHEAD